MAVQHWLKSNQPILSNSSSIAGTALATYGLGFLFWWAAARMFSPADVGFASVTISAMMLLGSLGMLGLGTLLITEIPRRPRERRSLITTALLVSACLAGLLGVIFSLLAPSLSAEFRWLSASVGTVLLFGLGVALTSATLVLDQATIGLLRGGLQLRRNLVFSIVKLAALFPIAWLAVGQVGMALYGAWALANVVSLVAIARNLLVSGRLARYRPNLNFIKGMRFDALKHHGLNLLMDIPNYTLPILAAAIISTTANASFYIAWMLASFASMPSTALTTALHAVGASDEALLREKARMTLRLGLVIALLATIVLLCAAAPLLNVYGPTYVAQAFWCLRILALGSAPRVLRAHYLTICRIRGNLLQGIAIFSVTIGLQLVLAATGASVGGLVGLSLGWLVALYVESAILAPVIWRLIARRS